MELQLGFKHGEALDGLKTSVAGESVLGEQRGSGLTGLGQTCLGHGQVCWAVVSACCLIGQPLHVCAIAGTLAAVLPGVDPSEVHQPVSAGNREGAQGHSLACCLGGTSLI